MQRRIVLVAAAAIFQEEMFLFLYIVAECMYVRVASAERCGAAGKINRRAMRRGGGRSDVTKKIQSRESNEELR
jgi:hypothetical protein